MNLIIEQSNTSPKVAVHKSGCIEASFVYKQFGVSVVAALFEKYVSTQGILSAVIDMDDELIACLKNELQRFVFLDEHVALPAKVEYGMPKTSGRGRLVAVVGVNCLRPRKNPLVIDAGTAVAYEVVEASGIFLGGNIPPGMTARFRTSNHFMKKLSLVTEKDDVPPIGRGMEAATQVGVMSGIVYEMDGYTDELKIKYPDLLVFLTGGHSLHFGRRLRNSILADINLVSTGLGRILEHNVEN